MKRLATVGTLLLAAACGGSGGQSGTGPGTSVGAFRTTQLVKAVAGDAVTFNVTALDTTGAVNTRYRGTVQFATDDLQAATPPDATFSPSDGGTVTAKAVFKTAGERTFVVVDKANPSAIGIAHVLVSPAAASRLAVSGAPLSVVAGVPFSLAVTSFDPYDNVATDFAGTVHFAAPTDAHAQLAPDSMFTPADAGSRSFSAALTTAGPMSLTVSSDGLAPATTSITVVHGPAAKVTLEGLPAQLAVDVIQPLTVTVRDVFDNPVTDYVGTLKFTNSDPQAPAIADVAFGAADLGARIVAVQFATAATQTVSAKDVAAPSVAGSASTQVVHGPAAALALAGLPSSTVAGASLTATVTVVDVHGNVVTDFAGTVHFASTDVNAALPADFAFTAADAGSHTFAIVLASVATSTLAVSCAGLPAAVASVVVRDAGAAQVAFENLPAQVALDAVQKVTVRVRDAFGNPVTSYTGTLRFTNTDPQATALPDAVFTAADLGSKIVTVQFATVGQQTLSATDTLTPSITGSVRTQVLHGPAARLSLSGIPPAAIAGATQRATIAAVDNRGNVATDFTGAVHFSSTDPTAALTSDIVFASSDQGVRTFAVAFTKAAPSSTLTASSAGLTPATATVAVRAAAASQVTLEGLPAQVVVDADQTLRLTVRDPFGNAATDYAGVLRFTNTDAQAPLIPDATFVAADGAVKSIVVRFATAGQQTLSARDAVSPSIAGSASTQVLHGPAAQLVLAGVAPTTVAGTLLAVTVTAVDVHGNAATDFTGTIHFASSDPTAQLPADFTFTAAHQGTRTFPVSLLKAGTSTLTVSTATLPSASATALVRPAAAAKVTLEGLPASVVAGDRSNVTVTVRDAFGNVATDYSGTLRFTTTDAQAPAIADAIFKPTDVNPGVKVVAVELRTAGTRSLSAADLAAPTIAGSVATQVLPGPAARLVVSGLPPSTTAGTLLTGSITALDAFGNVASGFTGTVHFSSTDPNAQLQSDTAFAATDKGVRSFSVVLTRAGSQSVTVSDVAGVATSATVTVSVVNGPAARIAVGGLPPQVAVDVAQSATLTVLDSFGNTAVDYVGTVRLTTTDPQVPTLPDAVFTATDRGSKAVAVQFRTAGTQTLSARDSVRAAVAGSASTVVLHGPVASLALSGIPASTTAGTLLTGAVTAVDGRGNVVTDFTGTVHFSSSDPNATLPPDATFTLADNGTRSFSASLVTAGARSISVSALGGVATAATVNVSVMNAPASRITLDAHAAQVAVDTNAVFTVTVRDRFGNPALDYRGTVHFVTSDPRALPSPDVTFTSQMFATIDVALQFATVGDQSLQAFDTVNAALTGSTTIKVTNGPFATYALSPLPASAVAGEPLALVIRAVDAHGNTVLDYAGSTAVTSLDPTDRLPPAGGFVNGVRNVSIAFVTAGQHRATVTEVGGTVRVDTSTVTIVSEDASVLVVANTSTTAGIAATAAVTAKDRFGNVVVSYTGTVALSSTDPRAILPAPYAFTAADAGQHGFSLTLVTAGTWTVAATDAVRSITGSGTFTVAPAAAANCDLVVVGRAGAQVGLRVRVMDPFANVATGYRGTVAFSSSDAAAQLPAPATYTATDAGARDFTAVLPTGGDQTVRATDAAVPFSCQASVSVVVGQFFAVSSTGTEAWAGTPRVMTVQAQDASGAPVTNYAGTIAFSSSDAAAVLPASVKLTGTEGGRASVNVTFNTIGLQTFTATDSVDAAKTGTAFQLVHGLVYTNPPSGGKVRLVLNAAASSASAVQLDLVSNTSLFTLGLVDPQNSQRVLPSSVRGGAFAAGMNLPLDSSKVGADAQLFVPAPPASAVLSFGAAPQAAGAALTTGMLYTAASQKRLDLSLSCTPPCTNDHLRGDVQVRPFPGASSLYYSFRLRLTPGSTPGPVFDGQALASNTRFRAAVRDRSGSDVFSGTADFAIGKLEVK